MPWWLYIAIVVAIYVAASKLNGRLWPYLRRFYALLSPRR